jgi:release factor glutamine methyltransferase
LQAVKNKLLVNTHKPNLSLSPLIIIIIILLLLLLIIIIIIIKGLAVLHRRPAACCTAIDLGVEAVALAGENARALGLADRYDVRLQPVQGLGSSALASAKSAASALARSRESTAAGGEEGGEEERYDVLLSNPPYIPEADMATLEPEVERWEDRRALCGGADGMDVVVAILERASSLLRGPGCEVWLEVDPSHPPLIRAWAEAHAEAKLEVVEVLEDLGGFERFVRLRLTAG